MKKLLKVALIAVGMLFAGNFAHAQSKVAHINFNDLIGLMPEQKTIRTQLDAFQKQYIDVITDMTNKYQTQLADFQKNQATMTDAVRTSKTSEIQDMQKRIQETQNDAQQKVDAKTSELYKPLVDKARAAISAIAKEKGYNYVLDSSQTSLLVAPDADDLMVAVRARLGLK